jgi:ABC-2 type transport system permease protein
VRQFGADLRRFAARRIVRGALLLVVAIMALVVTLATLAGDEVTPQQQAEYDAQMEAIQNQAPPSTFITEDGMVEGGVAYPDPPTDDRIKVVADLPDVLQGTGIALLFVAFVLGASFIGAEHNVGSLTTQLLYEPRRWRVHAGKAAAVLLGIFAFVLFSLTFEAAITYFGATINGVTAGADGEFWIQRAGQALRIAAIVAAGGAMAYGVTLVLRRTSAGIVAFFLQYPLLFLIDPEGKPLGFLSKYMPLRGLLVAIVDPASVSEGGDDLGIRTLAAGVVMTAVWIFVILAASGRLFSRAEIR